ncbi:hypothetical protein M0R45_031221 [Rubus argutus]|uniref:Uncharacterized protein n=1 Tax=Rubus argutus TaxID=59490 RepID=A0AAW1WFT7_RUBAR
MIHLFCKAKHIFEDLAEDYLSPDGKVVLAEGCGMACLVCLCNVFPSSSRYPSNGKEVIHSGARRRFRKHKHDKVGWGLKSSPSFAKVSRGVL